MPPKRRKTNKGLNETTPKRSRRQNKTPDRSCCEDGKIEKNVWPVDSDLDKSKEKTPIKSNITTRKNNPKRVIIAPNNPKNVEPASSKAKDSKGQSVQVEDGVIFEADYDEIECLTNTSKET